MADPPLPDDCPVSPGGTTVPGSNDPSALLMLPATRAEKSVPLPTVSGAGEPRRGNGCGAATAHGTSCHSTRGKEDLKQPFLGTASFFIAARHSSRLAAIGGCLTGSVEGF